MAHGLIQMLQLHGFEIPLMIFFTASYLNVSFVHTGLLLRDNAVLLYKVYF